MGFNFPKQVGTNGNHPNEADIQTHDVKLNDIFVLGSDGLFDNLFEVDIIDVIRPFIKTQDTLLDPELVAEMITERANQLSKNQTYQSPFAKEAYKHFYDYRGGKEDDITVIVAQVVENK